MSARESSDATHHEPGPSQAHERWLVFVALLGPAIALFHQGIIYAANSWTCGHGFQWSMHIAPVLGLLVIVVAGRGAQRWRAHVQPARHDADDPETRRWFLATVAVALCALSAIVVAAQWLAIFVFSACARP